MRLRKSARTITPAGVATILVLAGGITTAHADPPFECDDRFGTCGTPEMSGGGGGGGGGGGSVLVANTDLGDTYQFADDYDNDGLEDPYDNCPRWHNADQSDGDADGYGDSCDNCMGAANLDQLDVDADLLGDACDTDLDGDSIANELDSCARVPNPMVSGLQPDLDIDGLGDACDTDIDGDGMLNLEDPCPMSPSVGEPTAEQRAACFPDSDGDGVSDFDPLSPDKCPSTYDPDQLDLDIDGLGDACDTDDDGDGLLDASDACPAIADPEQLDVDRDGLGDMCDTRFCYTVMGNTASCLDPADVLDVYVPDLLASTGMRFRLPIFVNREAQPATYRWTIESAPTGSSATIANAEGSVAETVAYEYVYDPASVASFAADRPGTYTIRVQVVADGPDTVSGEVGVIAEHVMSLTVSGAPVAAGCSVTTPGSSGTSPLSALLALGSVALLLSRRRRAAR